jgi:polar amino acid transport system substrate-binding protein
LALALLVALATTTAAAGAEPIRVLANNVAPFYSLGADGTPAGLEHEILALFAKAQGRPLEVRWYDEFSEALAALDRGAGDVLAAGTTVTAERRARYDFSASYFPVRVQLVVPKGSAIAGLADLRGKRVATIAGTTYEKLLAAHGGLQLVHVANSTAMFAALAAGEVEALACDSTVMLALLPGHPGLMPGPALTAEQEIAFMLPKGSPLTAELSKAIRELKAAGIYYRLLDKHLGDEAVAMVRAGRAGQ